jgi:hypothetical protein
MADKYILQGRNVVPAADLMSWARWFETADRHVANEQIGACRVSTVFLGLDHSFGDGSPLLFETMVFPDGDGSDAWSDRCSTYTEALEMHARGCTFARDSQQAASEIINRAKSAN